MPIVLFGREFWQRLINFDFLVESGLISQADLELFILQTQRKRHGATSKLVRLNHPSVRHDDDSIMDYRFQISSFIGCP